MDGCAAASGLRADVSTKIEWTDATRQCQAAGVAVFVKQGSGPRPGKQGRIPDELWLKEMPR